MNCFNLIRSSIGPVHTNSPSDSMDLVQSIVFLACDETPNSIIRLLTSLIFMDWHALALSHEVCQTDICSRQEHKRLKLLLTRTRLWLFLKRVEFLVAHLSRRAGYESWILFCREGLSLCAVLCRHHNNHGASTNAGARHHLDLPDMCEPGIHGHHAQLH